MALLGYARVSTVEQNLDLQLNALEEAGCDRTFTEHVSGAAKRLPEREALLDYARPGDVIVVWRLDRLGRSLTDLTRIIEDLGKRGIGFKSLQESIDTTSPAGKLIFHVFASLAEFERDIISERTKAGVAAAKARGASVGRPEKLTARDLDRARKLIASGEKVADVAKLFQVTERTLYRRIARADREAASAASPASLDGGKASSTGKTGKTGKHARS